MVLSSERRQRKENMLVKEGLILKISGQGPGLIQENAPRRKFSFNGEKVITTLFIINRKDRFMTATSPIKYTLVFACHPSHPTRLIRVPGAIK